MTRCITAKLKTGGETFHLNPREHKVLLCLITKSPHSVPTKELADAADVSYAHLRRIISEIKPIVVLEGGTIETVARRGYRIISVGKFPHE